MQDTAVEVITTIGALAGIALQLVLVWVFLEMYKRLRAIDDRMKEMFAHTSKAAQFAEMGATDQRRWYEWQAQVQQHMQGGQ